MSYGAKQGEVRTVQHQLRKAGLVEQRGSKFAVAA